MKRSFFLIMLLSVMIFPSVSYGQISTDQSETSSTVKELTDFHEIIYPIWHNAYPAKDYKALKEFIPEIKTYMEALNKAKLPGILRDKESAWKVQLNELNGIVKDYTAAASANDDNALMAAAEKLHSGYEKMVRLIRPAFKEIDDFHQTLYIIYHKLLPDSKFDEIAGLTSSLTAKAEAIMNYPHDKLKARLGDKIEKYDASAKKLYNSTLTLNEVLKGTDKEKKKSAVEVMHSSYEELNALF